MRPTDQILYDADFYRWSKETAEALRERRFEDVDADHVAEEIEDVGKREKRELHGLLDRLTETSSEIGLFAAHSGCPGLDARLGRRSRRVSDAIRAPVGGFPEPAADDRG
jgi:hypothetical protein